MWADLDDIKGAGGTGSEDGSRGATGHGLPGGQGAPITLILAPEHPVDVVLGPEQAHLIATVPQDGGGASRPEPKQALLPDDGSCGVDGPLRSASTRATQMHGT